jgi:hypothetical protein
MDMAAGDRVIGLSDPMEQVPHNIVWAQCDLCKGISIEALVSPGGYAHAQSPEAHKDCLLPCAICLTLFADFSWKINTEGADCVDGSGITLHLACGSRDEILYSELEVRLHGRVLKYDRNMLVRTIEGNY